MLRSMRYVAGLVATLASGLVLASPVQVVGTPTLQFFWGANTATPGVVNQQTQVISIPLGGADGTDFQGTRSWQWGVGPEQDIITITMSGNVDPVITIGIGFTDNGTPSVFSFSTSAPLAPTLFGLQSYRLDLLGSVADAGGGGSIGIGTTTFGMMDATLNGTPFAGIGTGLVYPAGFVFPYGPFTQSGTVNCGVGGCTTFGLNISVLGAGGGDSVSMTGRFEIAPVPVPAAALLFAPALGLLGFARRRPA